MDYKELIEELRMVASWDGICYDCNQCVKAAAALETMLAERDAAVTLTHGKCYACKNKETKYSDEPCSLCKWGAMRCMVPVAKLQDSWEWRGPQKEED